VALSDYKDKLLLVDFWTTWCKLCVEMMPSNRAVGLALDFM
jgi:thiol-disulfide isomerase/thioredoxin